MSFAVPRTVLLVLWLATAILAQHPQATTDCSNCHDDPQTGHTVMWQIHDYDCALCHANYDFRRTILGPIGTWDHDCTTCHRESMAVTGNLHTAQKGHRCTICHGQPMSVGDPVAMHQAHAGKANCVVCHGFVPDAGTVIGSGNRHVCTVCHRNVPQVSTRRMHAEMTRRGLNCLECHGGERPPVDVAHLPPVGNTAVVCELCHTGQSPSAFARRGVELHRRHREKGLDCGSCHLDANLQDDHDVMPPYDDVRRALVDRSGSRACVHCHGRTPTASTTTVHARHGDLWCYDCHDGTDLRPLGQVPPVNSARQACSLCHAGASHDAPLPFDVHARHAEQKCFTCHLGGAPLRDWPQRLLRPPGVLGTYGTGCAGPRVPPVLSMAGSPHLGQSVEIRLAGATGVLPAVLALGLRGESMNLANDGMEGCTLLVEIMATMLTITAPGGSAAIAMPVPPQPGLVGVAMYFQWFAPDQDANQRGIAASNGGRATVGP